MSYAEDYGLDCGDETEVLEHEKFMYNIFKSLNLFKRELKLRKENKHLKKSRLWNNKPIKDMTTIHIMNAVNYCKKYIGEENE